MTNEEKQARIEQLYVRSKLLFRSVPELTVAELDRLSSSTEVVLVDVRTAKEQRVSMIPGAVPVRDFERRAERYRGRAVVAYCTLGHRSGLYCKRLLKDGWQAFNLRGAILAWTHADRELAGGETSTRRVHVGGPKWSLEAEGYEPVW